MKELRECFRCEKEFEQKNMLHTGGCWLCEPCYKYIEVAYEEEMAKEYNHLPQTCRGCE